MKRCSPEERELCAKHEATHLVFAVILQARILNVGIPRVDGRKPCNPLGRGSAKANNGYIDCFHVHEECDGFISLGGHCFEKAYGDVALARPDYEHAESTISPDTIGDAEALADALIIDLDDTIDFTANELLAKARKDGVIHWRKLDKITESIRSRLGFKIHLIRRQIENLCITP